MAYTFTSVIFIHDITVNIADKRLVFNCNQHYDETRFT